MTMEEMFRQWSALPPQAQKQVADFIAFLREQYGATETDEALSTTDLSEEPYVGMWSDRPDMEDSTAWVRTTRKQEWTG
jgi:hypothetical protein